MGDTKRDEFVWMGDNWHNMDEQTKQEAAADAQSSTASASAAAADADAELVSPKCSSPVPPKMPEAPP